MIAQSSDTLSIPLNGSLIEIGDYSDLLYERAVNDSAQITIDVDGEQYCWGYKDREIKDKRNIFSLLRHTGDQNRIGKFENYNYISAERWGPRNNVALNTTSRNPFWLGKYGEYTIPVLGRLSARDYSQKDEEGHQLDQLRSEDPRIYSGLDTKLILNNINCMDGRNLTKCLRRCQCYNRGCSRFIVRLVLTIVNFIKQ